jgi:hypothetical protein
MKLTSISNLWIIADETPSLPCTIPITSRSTSRALHAPLALQELFLLMLVVLPCELERHEAGGPGG